MKTYTFADLKRICPQQGYKLACLESLQGDRLQPNNNIKFKIDKQLGLLESRLKSELYQDGYYYIGLAQTMTKARTPDKYLIYRGKGTPPALEENFNTPKIIDRNIIQTVHADVLTYESALKMQQEISDLKSANKMLELENEFLQAEIEDLKSENLEEVSNATPNDTMSNIKTFMSETMPTITGIMDKYFEQQDKKLNLEEKKLNLQKTNQSKSNPIKRSLIIPASPEHIALITHLHKADTPESLNKLEKELDKLELANRDLYLKICTDLGIEIDESGSENPE